MTRYEALQSLKSLYIERQSLLLEQADKCYQIALLYKEEADSLSLEEASEEVISETLV